MPGKEKRTSFAYNKLGAVKETDTKYKFGNEQNVRLNNLPSNKHGAASSSLNTLKTQDTVISILDTQDMQAKQRKRRHGIICVIVLVLIIVIFVILVAALITGFQTHGLSWLKFDLH